LRSEKNIAPKVKVETKVEVDDTCSTHTTLIEVIAQDQLGLLYRVSSQLSQQNCNIEIAVIETEGQMAIDAFYVTSGGRKLDPGHQQRVRDVLLAELASS